VISRKTRETSAFDRLGSASLPASHEGPRLIITTLIVLALLASSRWWFGLR
jgi:hypothetical protein